MTITLYELSAADPNTRFSLHCWKSHLALAHKQLSFQTEPVGFLEKHKLAFSGQQLVPVLQDNELVISDSWDIAVYLDSAYPEGPQLFPDEASRAQAESFNRWLDNVLAQHIRPMIILDIYEQLDEETQVYFRQSREEKFGRSLEEVGANPEKNIPRLRAELDSIRDILQDQHYMGGQQPDYSDMCLMGLFLWISCVSDIEFLEKSDVVYAWYQRMLKLYAQVIPEAVVNKY